VDKGNGWWNWGRASKSRFVCGLRGDDFAGFLVKDKEGRKIGKGEG